MSGQTILIVDDNLDMLRILESILKAAGFNVVSARDGLTALRTLYEKRPHLVLLDIRFDEVASELDGYAVCRRIREVSDVPVIMLTSQYEPEQIIEGLEAGADDYIRKPYQKDVLIARIRANLRRASIEHGFDRNGVIYSDAFLTVNLDERRVFKEGKPVKLSPTEFNLLVSLIEESPRVVPYRDLLNNVWGYEYINDVDYLRVYIWHLRRKLEENPKQPLYLVNELGVGYRFEKRM